MLPRVAVIIVLGFIAFGSMLPAPFRVMDDRISIVENAAIKSAKNISLLFKEGFFHDQSYYRPLINLSFMGEYHLFGLKSFFYNVDNLILHIANALLVFLLVSRLMNNTSIGFWTSILFVLHPVQWEAVCNIPGRAILLSALFVLSSFILFLEFYKSQRWVYMPVVLVTFFLGLLCKESAGMLAFVAFAYLSLDKAKPWPQKINYLLPFLLGVMAYVLLRVCLGITTIHQASQPIYLILGFVTFLRSVITDLRLFVLPIDLHYDRCLPLMMSFKDPQVLAVCLFWLTALIVFIRNFYRINPINLFLMSWFALELFPVSQLVTSIGVGVGHISTAEHFLYLACIPVFIGMVMAFRWLYQINIQKDFLKPGILKFIAGSFLGFLLLIAIEQSIYAANEFNMISRSLAFESMNPRVQSEMAMLAVFRKDLPEAEKHFRAAIKAEPNNPAYHIGLATALCQQGKYIEGLEHYVIFDPGKDKALVERQEKLTIAHIQEQISQGKSFDFRGWLAVGIYYAKINDHGRAIDAFLHSLSLNPDQADDWFNLGSIYEGEHDWPHAINAYQKLLALTGITDFQREFALAHLKEIETK